jgi:hypothetical protein
MGKIDDMRKRREAQYAQEAGAKPPVDVEATDSLTGKCAICGKNLAVQNGLVAQHQKGLGKFCPGSRKAPAG